MAFLDLEKLIAPVSEADPSGPSLEYDVAFAALEKAALGRAEQVIGGVVTAAEPPDWNVVFDGALSLIDRTKDLRVAARLSQALLYRNGVSGFGEGIALLRGLLERHWASLHPRLDPEDDNDPTMRVTALSALTTPAILLALRAAALVDSRALGPVSLSDMAPLGTAPDAARISGAVADAELTALEASSAALARASGDLRGIESVFEANAGSRGPDLGPLVDYFHKAHNALEPRVAERRAAAVTAAVPVDTAPASLILQSRGLSGDILSREDVVKALEKISLYYQKNEPSSPVPLVIERCKRLVSMGFLEILTDVAPDGLKQAQLVVGKQGDSK